MTGDDRPAEDRSTDDRRGQGEPAAGRKQAEPEWRRRQRLARIFGDVLPETTDDERDPEGPRESASDAWLRSQIPPHHGG